MCGISGIVYFNEIKISRKIISQFNNQLTHRGPDGEGVHVDEKLNLGLGHRRLSILDLSEKATQPMSFSNERYWMVYNGEVFNFIELKDELISLGYSFQTESDSEVVLAAYSKWGRECVNKFNGMWALVILDKEKQQLFISRDRFGIKPLYYLRNRNLFAFASESIAFNKLHGYTKRINSNNTVSVITNPFSLEGTGSTIYEEIFQINAGHNATLDLRTKEFKQYKWWDTFENRVDTPKDYDDQVAMFKELLEDATKIRMRSDVPLASALSGGVDSSAVYCMINNIMKGQKVSRVPSDWQKAYNVGFPGSIFDESHFAKEVIDYTGGKASYLVPDYSNLVDDVVKTTMLFDNIYNSPIYPLSMVYGAMQKDNYKISMDGHGVDEMMFGYKFSIKKVYLNAIKTGDYKQAEAVLETYLGMHPQEEREAQVDDLERSAAYHTRSTPNIMKRGIRKIGRLFVKKTPNQKQINWFGGYSPNEFPVSSIDDSVGLDYTGPYNNFHKTVLPTILRNFDRGGMQQSIEIRMPFMDWRLVSFVFSLPTSSTLGGGYTKRILRDSMAGLMPETIRTRKLKVGMSSPMPKWFGNELKTLILDEVHSTLFQNSSLWKGREVSNFVDNKMKSNSWTYDDCLRFWSIFNAHLLIKNLNE